MIKIGAIETCQNNKHYSTIIYLEEPTNTFPIVVGRVSIYLNGDNQELIKALESGVKRVINKFNKSI